MNTITTEVKTLTAAFPNLPLKEQNVYWISNDGTDEVNLLTARPFSLAIQSQKGFKLRYKMKDWDKFCASSSLDYRAAGPFCMFGVEKALLKIFNQSIQYGDYVYELRLKRTNCDISSN